MMYYARWIRTFWHEHIRGHALLEITVNGGETGLPERNLGTYCVNCEKPLLYSTEFDREVISRIACQIIDDLKGTKCSL